MIQNFRHLLGNQRGTSLGNGQGADQTIQGQALGQALSLGVILHLSCMALHGWDPGPQGG